MVSKWVKVFHKSNSVERCVISYAKLGRCHVLSKDNYTGAHWRLIVVDTRKKEIKSYDSMLLDDESCIHNVRYLILSLRF